MPTDLLLRSDGKTPRVDLSWGYLPFVERLLNVLAAARLEGQDFYPTELFRKWSRSHVLYLAFLNGGPRAAPAGFSAHGYGLACDVAADSDHDQKGLQTAWDEPHYAELFEVLRTVVPACGLAWGGEFGDRPHIGWPGFESKKQLVPLHEIYLYTAGDERTKVRAVHSFLDTQPVPPVPWAPPSAP